MDSLASILLGEYKGGGYGTCRTPKKLKDKMSKIAQSEEK